jgi:hypothetical protein
LAISCLFYVFRGLVDGVLIQASTRVVFVCCAARSFADTLLELRKLVFSSGSVSLNRRPGGDLRECGRNRSDSPDRQGCSSTLSGVSLKFVVAGRLGGGGPPTIIIYSLGIREVVRLAYSPPRFYPGKAPLRTCTGQGKSDLMSVLHFLESHGFTCWRSAKLTHHCFLSTTKIAPAQCVYILSSEIDGFMSLAFGTCGRCRLRGGQTVLTPHRAVALRSSGLQTCPFFYSFGYSQCICHRHNL